MHFHPVLACSLLSCLALATPAAASDPMRQVDVVVDMTPAGRKVAHPSPEKPAYYFPIIGGYKELGSLVAGEKPPVPSAVVHMVAVELAKEGYLTCLRQVPASAGHPAHMAMVHAPDLLVVVHWGYLNPEVADIGTPGEPASKVYFNQDQMLALVGGNTLHNLDLTFEREDVMQAASEDRYFVSVSAYDAPAYFQQKKRVSLWQAKMSVASHGVYLGDVMTALVQAGGPLFGRETNRPKMLMAPLSPEGHVEVGTPTVKDYLDAPPPPPKAATPTSASPSPSQPAGTTPAHTPQ